MKPIKPLAKRLTTAVLFAATLASASIFSGGVAQAAPTSCRTWRTGGNASVLCVSGSGAYRATADCVRKDWLGIKHFKTVKGPWVRGTVSTSHCGLGWDIYWNGYNF